MKIEYYEHVYMQACLYACFHTSTEIDEKGYANTEFLYWTMSLHHPVQTIPFRKMIKFQSKSRESNEEVDIFPDRVMPLVDYSYRLSTCSS